MATRYSAQCFAPANLDLASLHTDLDRAVKSVDDEMSNWKDASDLTRLNQAAPGHWLPISGNLARVLIRGIEIGHETGNAFNVGVGDAVDAWGFGPGTPDRTACANRVAPRPLRPADEWLEVDANGRRARKLASVTLDLCGIAKGFAVDELGRVMDRHGIGNWLVGIDGEMRAKGMKPLNAMWAVAIERPNSSHREAMAVLELTDVAIATSGDYRHWQEHEGTRIHHTMDPCTGAPLHGGVASVTVLARTCMDADAYATALMVLGEDRGMQFARDKQLDALFVMREGEGLRTKGTGCFAAS
nr:FAD:protein FMN transferase [Paraburkholderia adhaesiva]